MAGLSQEVIMMSAYSRQAMAADQRGLEFLFTFAEWVKWWENSLGPTWLAKRGKQGDQYCMARKGDKGPYAAWNVECITNAENGKDRIKNKSCLRGEQVNSAKLTTAQVIKIYLSKVELTATARRYGVNISTIRNIRNGKRWSHVTFDLGPPPFKRHLDQHLLYGGVPSKGH